MPRKRKLTKEIRDCITLCKECARTCVAAVPHAITLEGEHFSRPHVSLLNLCADICQIAARTLLMDRDFDDPIRRACASVCDACAHECENLDEDFMRKCAEVCRRCARSCRKIDKGLKLAA